jgi:phosphatidylglycerophosphate synthase
LKSRDTGWARVLAGLLVRWRVRPNTISLFSVLFAALAGKARWAVPDVPTRTAVWLYVGAAAGIQLRLLANLLDGMVAIEGGMKSKTGEIWNDLPDHRRRLHPAAATLRASGPTSLDAGLSAILTA